MRLTSEEIGGAIRSIISVLLGLAVGKGWIDGGIAAELAAPIAIIVMSGWSIWSKRANAQKRSAR